MVRNPTKLTRTTTPAVVEGSVAALERDRWFGGLAGAGLTLRTLCVDTGRSDELATLVGDLVSRAATLGTRWLARVEGTADQLRYVREVVGTLSAAAPAIASTVTVSTKGQRRIGLVLVPPADGIASGTVVDAIATARCLGVLVGTDEGGLDAVAGALARGTLTGVENRIRLAILLPTGGDLAVMACESETAPALDPQPLARAALPNRGAAPSPALRRRRRRVTLALLLPAATILAGGMAWAVTARPGGAPAVASSGSAPIPAGRGPIVAYDAARGDLVFFGGVAASDPNHPAHGDTWTWDRGVWVERHPPTSPPPGANGAMAYDPATRTVLFYGMPDRPDAHSVFHYTWRWDGSAWTELSVSTFPTSRARPLGMVYDEAVGRIVLVTACCAGGPPGDLSPPRIDTWTWDGSIWVAYEPAQPLPAPGPVAMAFDAARSEVVALVPMAGSARDLSTWTWDGATWTAVRPPQTLRLDDRAVTMAYDPSSRRVIAVELGAAGRGRDLFEAWDGTAWTQLPVVPPNVGAGTPGATAVWDGAAGRILLVNGPATAVGSLG